MIDSTKPEHQVGSRFVCKFCGKKRNQEFLTRITGDIRGVNGWICKEHTSIISDNSTIRQVTEKPVFVELFSGSKQISNYAESVGFEAISVDIVEKYKPSICCDVTRLKRDRLPGTVHVLWASIPCTVYSILNLANHWHKISLGYRNYHYVPKTPEAKKAEIMLNKTLSLISEINPVYFFIENPRGALRHFSQMKLVPYLRTVSYADFGADYYKPTDIFTNCKDFNPVALSGCMGKSFPRTVKDLPNAYERSKVPGLLIEEVFDSFKHKFL